MTSVATQRGLNVLNDEQVQLREVARRIAHDRYFSHARE